MGSVACKVAKRRKKDVVVCVIRQKSKKQTKERRETKNVQKKMQKKLVGFFTSFFHSPHNTETK